MVLAMMTSLDSVFNCLSTIFTYDIYKRFLHPEASRRRQVWIGQLATGVAALCGLAWLPMIANSANGLYLTTQSAQTHMSPTLVAVFLVGLFWPRANGPGALAGMIVGFTVGIARFVATRIVTCDEGDTYSLTCMQFNHMALILFAIAAVVTVVVSLLTKPPEPSQVQGTTWWRSDAEGCEEEAGGNPGIGSLCAAGILLMTMAGLCLGFGYSGVDRQLVVGGSLLAPVGIACVAVVFVGGATLTRLRASRRRKAKQITGLQPADCEADKKAAEEPAKDEGIPGC
ncbi:Slc5a3 [Symbiodinium necroappetens]|uniref:Slc5a3 protein n=1 Tax=Symbiodinium necroappetens TaxID=1628268 RepID=A0A813CNT9_9DINO|nr:Slc5a3 [Symbiodinium necroappetens]